MDEEDVLRDQNCPMKCHKLIILYRTNFNLENWWEAFAVRNELFHLFEAWSKDGQDRYDSTNKKQL